MTLRGLLWTPSILPICVKAKSWLSWQNFEKRSQSHLLTHLGLCSSSASIPFQERVSIPNSLKGRLSALDRKVSKIPRRTRASRTGDWGPSRGRTAWSRELSDFWAGESQWGGTRLTEWKKLETESKQANKSGSKCWLKPKAAKPKNSP